MHEKTGGCLLNTPDGCVEGPHTPESPMNTPPFRAFSAPVPVATAHPEALAAGFGLGALAGALVPTTAVLAELAVGRGLADLLASPGAALIVTFTVPVVTALAGGWAAASVAAWRDAYERVAAKAGSLLSESLDLRNALDGVEPMSGIQAYEPDVDDLPVVTATWEDDLPTLSGALEDPQAESDADDLALISAQACLLASFGEATQDTARRMHINLEGLRLTELSVVQERLVDALRGHVDGLWDLADDVVGYVDEAPNPLPAQDHRSAKPRPPGARAVV